MTFLPIVDRELRVLARRRGSHGVRLLSAVAALLVGGWIMLIPYYRTPQRLGITMFVWLAGLAFLYSLFSGLFTTADCLSREKREGTLGLLFLADLRGYDIVFGKLAATSMNAFYGLVAIFPVMAIAFLSGGVTPGELGRAVLALVNTMFFSLGVGMVASALCQDDRRAGFATVLVILVMAAGMPLFGVLVHEWLHVGRKISPLFLVWSPGCAIVSSFEDVRKSTGVPELYGYSMLVIHIMSWASIVMACLIVPRQWQDKAISARNQNLRQRWREWTLGAGETRRRFRVRMLSVNPILWLSSRDRVQPLLVWLFLALAAFAWLWGWSENGRQWLEQAVWMMSAVLLNGVFKFWMASAAVKRFNEDQQGGALELLLVTPLKVREMVRGQLMALRRQFLKPALLVLAVDLICMASDLKDEEWVLMCSLGIVIFVLDMFTLAWVGMWMGLNIKRSNRASGAAITRILVLPWLIFFVAMTIFGLSRVNLPGSSEEEFFMLTWFGIGAGVDFIFYLRARRGLLERFRQVAARRFAPKKSGWWMFGDRTGEPVR